MVAAQLFICVTATVLRNLAPIADRCHTGDNVGMDAGEQLAAESPDRLERARKVLIEKRDARSDPDEMGFLTSIIRGLEKGRR